MVDFEVIRKILTSLEESLTHLESKKDISFEQYKKDRDIQAIVERRLETTIQACIDIGNHIISHNRLGIPNYYGEIFIVLEQNGIISKQTADEMVKMAGFRNILSHEYRELIQERVYEIMQNKLHVFRLFAKEIIKYIS